MIDAREWAEELMRVIRVDGQGHARTFAEAGYPLPWGVELTLPTGARIYLQTVTDPSAAHRPAEGPPVPPLPAVELPTQGPTELAAVERWLGACLTAPPSPWIETVELFQHRRPGRHGILHGLSVRAHSGARAWLYFRHATPAGRDPRGMAVWRLQGTV